MPTHPRPSSQGPFRVEQLREGDRYELSQGHPIYCAPSGRDHAGRNVAGAGALETDPEVEWAGVDAGFTPESGTLRAPDIAVAAPGEERGWIPGVPPLAVEYAGVGQDEQELEDKIAELLEHGTQQVWVVRLVGPRRVEVRCPGQPMRVLGQGEELTAPGILRNPVPVEALYDRDASHRVMLRNLLQRQGYDSLADVHDQGKAEGELNLVLRLLDKRLGRLAPELVDHIRRLDSAQLNALGEALLDFQQECDLRAWLEQLRQDV